MPIRLAHFSPFLPKKPSSTTTRKGLQQYVTRHDIGPVADIELGFRELYAQRRYSPAANIGKKKSPLEMYFGADGGTRTRTGIRPADFLTIYGFHCRPAADKPMTALNDFERAIKLNPNSVRAYKAREKMFREQKLFDDALASYDHAIQLSSNDAGAHNEKCWISAFHLERFDEALPACERAVSLNRIAAHLHSRGFVFQHLAQPILAEQDFREALRLDPDMTAAKDGLAALEAAR